MTEQVADRAVEFALETTRELGGESIDVVFFGGEPLMQKDLLYHIVERFQSVGGDLSISFKMSTNGLLLSEETLSRLLSLGVYISISIDGLPEIQDRQRPFSTNRGSSEQLNKVIPLLLRTIPSAHVNCVIIPESAAALDQSVDWLYQQGFRYISTPLDHGNPGWNRSTLKSLGKAYERLAKWYEARIEEGSKFHLGCFDGRIRLHTTGPVPQAERCSPGKKSYSIAPSGRLYACVQFVREDQNDDHVIGDIWNGLDSARASDYCHHSTGKRSECEGCALVDRCSSWCACVNWQSTGSLTKVSPLVCEHERMVTPIVDRMANRLWKKRRSLFIHKHYNPNYPLTSFIEDIILDEALKAEEESCP